MARAAGDVSDRWAARPVLGGALRLVALLAPVVVGLAVALLLARLVRQPVSGAALAGWWVLVLGGSAAAVFATDRLARRLLPLAILLELSLIFPDRAPSRLRAARTSSVRDLDQRLSRLRAQGVEMEPYEAAETVVTLVGILGLHDKRTRGHSERVRAFTDLLTGELGLDEDARVRLRWAALVHDLGKLSVPAPVLTSPGQLDEHGWELMHRHPEEGVRLLGGLLPWLGEWGDAVGQHHERYDGTGYPAGLAGEQISYAARIVALADSFEVMTSARSYKTGRSAAWARAELTRCAGTQFDPALVRAFLGISLGRLRWVLGPVTWLAELPFVVSADRAGQTVKVASVTALSAGLLATGALPGGAPVPPPADAAVATGQGRSAGLGVATGDGLGSAAGSVLTGGEAAEGLATTADRVAPAPAPARSAPDAAPSPTAQALAGGGGGTTARTEGETRPEPAAEPQAQPQPAAEPALAPAYHLTSRGLQSQPSSTRDVVSVPVGGSRSFDHRVDRAVQLPADRDLVLFVAFPTRQGNAKVAARLLDCSATGCEELSTGMVTQDKSSTQEFHQYVVPLSRAVSGEQQLPAGHVLRVEVRFLEPGAKGPGRLSLGGSQTPSRLRLPPGQ